MKFKDYYEILGVKRDASQDEIRSTYRKLACKLPQAGVQVLSERQQRS